MNTISEIIKKLYDNAEKTAKTLFDKGLTDKDVEFVFETKENKMSVLVRAKSEKGYVALKELEKGGIDD